MTRGIISVLLILNTTLLIAQHATLRGIVLDKASKEPVPYVHIFPVNGISGTLSDLNGAFSIRLSSTDDSLRISCIGYKTRWLPTRNLPGKNQTIELEEDRVQLADFIVHALSAKEFIRKCVSKIPDNYRERNTSKAFYWNSVMHEDVCTDFYEGYLHVSKKKIKYDSTVLNVRSKAEHITVFDSLQDILSFDVVNQRSMFVNPANLDDWKFDYLYSSEYPEGKFIVIEAVMIQNPFEKGNESNTLKIFIEISSHAIVRIDFTYQWSDGKRYTWKDDVQFTVSRLNGTVEYNKRADHKYGLSYLFISTTFSFIKRYNPRVVKNAYINHELVMLDENQGIRKPVVRWNDYLEATGSLSPEKSVSGQD